MIEPKIMLFQESEKKRRELLHIDSAQKATKAAEITTGEIRDDLNDADAYIQEKQFTQLYETASNIAGKSVRLAAIARQGMIETEGGDNGSDETD